MIPGLLRLLPLPLGLLGGMAGGALWWLILVLNPDIWNDLDEIEGYVIGGTIFMGWGLLHGCLFAFVPGFRKQADERAGVSYRLRRMLWLFTIPVLAIWAGAITIAVVLAQASGVDEEVILALIFPATVLGTAWIAQEVCDWIQPVLPPVLGAAVAACAIVILSLSLGAIVVLATPYLWEMVYPQGNPTAMASARDLLSSDLEGFSFLMVGPAVHGGMLAVIMPTCEAVWRVPRPRRRDLGARPYLLLALPTIALFDLLAVIIHAS
jgi:hypothetical protein